MSTLFDKKKKFYKINWLIISGKFFHEAALPEKVNLQGKPENFIISVVPSLKSHIVFLFFHHMDPLSSDFQAFTFQASKGGLQKNMAIKKLSIEHFVSHPPMFTKSFKTYQQILESLDKNKPSLKAIKSPVIEQ